MNSAVIHPNNATLNIHTNRPKLFTAKREAERATFKTGSVTWKKAKDSISLDSKALLKQYPEYLNQFSQPKQGTRRFNIYSYDD